jgi:hypothetical protein
MICDDDINIANYIKSLIESNYKENIKIKTYCTVKELENSIFNKETPNKKRPMQLFWIYASKAIME